MGQNERDDSLRMPMAPDTRGMFPNLNDDDFECTSEDTIDYNCIAHAAGDKERWWWPSAVDSYWPRGVPQEETPEAFVQAYATIGYELCDGAELEDGFEKIAIYVWEGLVRHAAIQLVDGRWSSKLGSDIDIRHRSLECLVGFGEREYGQASIFLRRRRIP